LLVLSQNKKTSPPTKEERGGMGTEERIQLFRQNLSNKSAKAYATMPIGIMGSNNLALFE